MKKIQDPISKLQRSAKLQISLVLCCQAAGSRRHETTVPLEVEDWLFFGSWILDFGA